MCKCVCACVWECVCACVRSGGVRVCECVGEESMCTCAQVCAYTSMSI